jgi:hypothetical protein
MEIEETPLSRLVQYNVRSLASAIIAATAAASSAALGLPVWGMFLGRHRRGRNSHRRPPRAGHRAAVVRARLSIAGTAQR